MDQRINISIEGEAFPEKSLKSIEKWIKLNPALRDCKIENKIPPTKKGEMGIDPTWLIEIVLGSTVVAELIRCVRDWKKSTGSKIIINIRHNDEIEYVIDGNGKITEQTNKK